MHHIIPILIICAFSALIVFGLTMWNRMSPRFQRVFLFLFIASFILTARAASLIYQMPVYAATPLLIQTGTCNTAGAAWVSNSFTLPYGSPPTVTFTQVGITNSPTNIIDHLTATGFNITNGAVNVGGNWTAIGTP